MSYFIKNNNISVDNKIEIKNDNSINLDGKIYGYIDGFNLKLLNKLKSKSLFAHNYVKKTVKSMIEEKIND